MHNKLKLISLIENYRYFLKMFFKINNRSQSVRYEERKKERKNQITNVFFLTSNCVVSSIGNPDSSMHATTLRDNFFSLCACIFSVHDIRKEEN
jgi:hypothetical protein